MRPVVGNTSSQGKKPATPTIGTATAGNASATVPFTESTYRGKTDSGTYRATSSPGSLSGTCAAPCSSISVTGLSNGTAYTFSVSLETPYGVNSDASSASNSVTPVAPPFFPPSFPTTTTAAPDPCAGYTCVSCNAGNYTSPPCAYKGQISSCDAFAFGCPYGGYFDTYGDANCGCPATFANFAGCAGFELGC